MTTPAHVVGTVADQRPEPNPFAVALTQHFWAGLTPQCPRWRHEPADAYARRLYQWMKENKPSIIRIPGDAPAQGERHE